MLELIHCFVEVLDKHFGQVCELDIMNEPEIVGGGSMLLLQCAAWGWRGRPDRCMVILVVSDGCGSGFRCAASPSPDL